ncbi:hypothetical protein AX16_004713 [Volvariella volvacea WC 439]|nr:hypothetical protein AX16_004713 [Volvariella volvacea WC 439]
MAAPPQYPTPKQQAEIGRSLGKIPSCGRNVQWFPSNPRQAPPTTSYLGSFDSIDPIAAAAGQYNPSNTTASPDADYLSPPSDNVPIAHPPQTRHTPCSPDRHPTNSPQTVEGQSSQACAQGTDQPQHRHSHAPTCDANFLSNAYIDNRNGVIQVNASVSGNPALKSILDILLPHICSQAMFDGDDRSDAPICHPETRKSITADIERWSVSVDMETGVLWLVGPLGMGKSAIARTVSVNLDRQDARLIVGSFFFWRNDNRRNSIKAFVPTIAYRLSMVMPEVGALIAGAIAQNPSILNYSIQSQWNTLIIEPLSRVFGKTVATRRALIIIDGLDECEPPSHQLEILQLLPTIYKHGLHRHVAFLVASRPESQIESEISALIHDHPSLFRLPHLELLETIESREDMQLVLTTSLNDIRRRYHRIIGNHQWPPQDATKRIVDLANGQFIYVHTIVRWLAGGHPVERLDIILGAVNTQQAQAFASLDLLYNLILKAAYNGENGSLVLPCLFLITDLGGLDQDSKLVKWEQELRERHRKQERELEGREEDLKVLEEDLKVRERKLKDQDQEVKEQKQEIKDRDQKLGSRAQELEKREQELEELKEELRNRKWEEVPHRLEEVRRGWGEVKRGWVEVQKGWVEIQKECEDLQTMQDKLQLRQEELQRGWEELGRGWTEVQRGHKERQQKFEELAREWGELAQEWTELHQQQTWTLLEISRFFNMDCGHIRLILQPLQSVLRLPDSDSDPVEIYHQSFSEYLHNKPRSGIYHAGDEGVVRLLLIQALELDHDHLGLEGPDRKLGLVWLSLPVEGIGMTSNLKSILVQTHAADWLSKCWRLLEWDRSTVKQHYLPQKYERFCAWLASSSLPMQDKTRVLSKFPPNIFFQSSKDVPRNWYTDWMQTFQVGWSQLWRHGP